MDNKAVIGQIRYLDEISTAMLRPPDLYHVETRPVWDDQSLRDRHQLLQYQTMIMD